MSYDDKDKKITRRQAYNLAKADAIVDGKQHDLNHVLKLYYKELQILYMIDKNDPKALVGAAKAPEIIDLLDDVANRIRGG